MLSPQHIGTVVSKYRVTATRQRQGDRVEVAEEPAALLDGGVGVGKPSVELARLADGRLDLVEPSMGLHPVCPTQVPYSVVREPVDRERRDFEALWLRRIPSFSWHEEVRVEWFPGILLRLHESTHHWSADLEEPNECLGQALRQFRTRKRSHAGVLIGIDWTYPESVDG